MKGQRIILVAMVIALVVAVVAITSVMAGDDDSTLRVVNKTDRDVLVEIYGVPSVFEDSYGNNDEATVGVEKVFIVPAGGTDDILLDNDETYYYAYRACGDNLIDAEIDMKDDVTIVINPCDRQPTTLKVRNHTGETIEVTLVGSEEKTFKIEPGLTRIEIDSGETLYSYDACSPTTDFNGVISIKANGRSDLVIRSCEYYASLVFEFGAKNVVGFNIINHASFPVILSVIGPMNDLIELSPGRNRVTLVVGSYQYSYYMDYNLVYGAFFVSPNGNGTVIVSPSFTIDNGLVDQEEFE